MRKLVHFFIIAGLMLCCVMTWVSGGNLQLIAQDTGAKAMFKMMRPLPAAPGDMMIYQTVTPEVKENQVKSLMQVLAMKGDLVDRGKQWLARDGEKTLEIFKEPGTGYLRFSNNDQLGAEKAVKNLPSEAEAQKKARHFLEANGLFEKNMYFRGSGYCEYRKFGPKGDVLEEGRSALKVGFGFKVNGTPVEGPGAKAGVIFGAGGEIIGVSRIWRPLKPLKKAKIIPPGAALDKFKRRWPSEGDAAQLKGAGIRTRVNIKEVRLTYFAKPGCFAQGLVKPVYIFEGDFTVARGEEKVEEAAAGARGGEPFVIVVPATAGDTL